jgi:hypothetical protein
MKAVSPHVKCGENRCQHCGKNETAVGHDGCLGEIPGVIFACCGHGNPAHAYIYWENGLMVRGFDVVRRIEPQEAAISRQIKEEIFADCGKYKYG